jgi:hypothetical protein
VRFNVKLAAEHYDVHTIVAAEQVGSEPFIKLGV